MSSRFPREPRRAYARVRAYLKHRRDIPAPPLNDEPKRSRVREALRRLGHR